MNELISLRAVRLFKETKLQQLLDGGMKWVKKDFKRLSQTLYTSNGKQSVSFLEKDFSGKKPDGKDKNIKMLCRLQKAPLLSNKINKNVLYLEALLVENDKTVDSCCCYVVRLHQKLAAQGLKKKGVRFVSRYCTFSSFV